MGQVSVATGKIFGAWVDLREGDTFGEKFTLEIDPSKAIFVPRGVGNAFQALEDGTAYSYLVNDHWVTGGENYAFVNLGCSKPNIEWPIPLDQAEVSEKDKNHPHISEVTPMKPRKTIILGSGGQLGKALRDEFPEAEFADRTTFDITKPETWGDRNWRQYETIINAAAYTKVDLAETEGRADAWAINATAVGNLAKLATDNNLTLVHISSDYVFDGTREIHNEDEPFSPLGVYGQSKAAGDIAAATVPNHYIIRTSWVIGEGNNFVNIMKSLAEKGVNPSVVNDQIGRLTFTPDIARAIKHLLKCKPPIGTYNVSSEGSPTSWFDVAQHVFEFSGHDKTRVSGVTTSDYYKGKDGIAPRPISSTLKLTKIQNTGFKAKDWNESLINYL
jgi:dTDP-4-dehydrorhamnose reductase